MEICNKTDLCTGCGVCAVQCPVQCIAMVENEEGFFYPVIDNDKCINCGKCKKLCPSNQPESIRQINTSDTCYAFQNADPDVLRDSSSGGFFSAAANVVLSRGGVVYAAVMDDSYQVHHARIDNTEGLKEGRKSKYLQSRAWVVYDRVKEDLKAGRIVLFTGTPCQIAAVKQIADNPNLYTIDLVCHGVANCKIVNSYLASISLKMKGTISKLFFRYKPQDSSGGGVIMHIEFEDGREYDAPSMQDSFMIGFNSNLFLRKSCYQCSYAGVDRTGDITIGDFWGLGTLGDTKISHKQGVNFVKLNSEKGAKLFADIELLKLGGFEVHQLKEATLRNRTLTKPMKYNNKRTMFFSQIEKEDFGLLIAELSKTYKLERKISAARDKLLIIKRKLLG